MATYTLRIQRFNPDDGKRWDEECQVDVDPRDTVLEALRRHQADGGDLAFEYGCRDGRCGLCTVTVDGHPRLSCATRVKDGQVLQAQERFPVLRDLIVDRRSATPHLKRWQAYRTEATDMGVWQEPRDHQFLVKCNECLACCSACPEYEAAGQFPGPVVFGRLAMFGMQPGDPSDRVATARAGGLERCLSCSGCTCPQGVPVWSAGVKRLLGI